MARQLFQIEGGYVLKSVDGTTTRITENSFVQEEIDVDELTQVNFSDVSSLIQNMLENLDQKVQDAEDEVQAGTDAFE